MAGKAIENRLDSRNMNPNLKTNIIRNYRFIGNKNKFHLKNRPLTKNIKGFLKKGSKNNSKNSKELLLHNTSSCCFTINSKCEPSTKPNENNISNKKNNFT